MTAAATDNLIRRRWGLVVAAVLLQLALGAVYAWSVFSKALQASGNDFHLSKSTAALPFSVDIGMIFIGTFVGGRIQDAKGPRAVALGGGIIYSIGVLLAGLAVDRGQFWLLVLGYGVIAGFGLGCGYIVPIAMLQKWFPDHRGLITGIAVGGFGFGAVLTSPIAQALVSHYAKVPTRSFLWLGAAYLVMVIVGAS
ncbi:MAG TPA: MFS transporter, partial [Pseudonocardiaceae bacterium]